MKSLYAACLARLGLSQPQAASLHDVSLDTIKSWCKKRSIPKPGIWMELRAYEREIVDRSEEMRERWESGDGEMTIPAADPRDMMAAADFILTSDDATPLPKLAAAESEAEGESQ